MAAATRWRLRVLRLPRPFAAVAMTMLSPTQAIVPNGGEGGMTLIHELPLLGGRCRDVLDSFTGDAAASALVYLKACGFVRLRGIVDSTMLHATHGAFLQLEEQGGTAAFQHAPLREKRMQYALPFDEGPLAAGVAAVAAQPSIIRLLQEYLGPSMTLDVATVVVVAPEVGAQSLHRDLQFPGSLAVQVALHPITPTSGPLTLCGGTHNLTDASWKAVRERVLDLSERQPGVALSDLFPEALCTDSVVAAPAEVGDVVIYDSMTFHLGSVNERPSPRYAMYLNFKNSSKHPGVHPDFEGPQAAAVATVQHRAAFERRASETCTAVEGGCIGEPA